MLCNLRCGVDDVVWKDFGSHREAGSSRKGNNNSIRDDDEMEDGAKRGVGHGEQ